MPPVRPKDKKDRDQSPHRIPETVPGAGILKGKGEHRVPQWVSKEDEGRGALLSEKFRPGFGHTA